ncbi:hypothetical protein [Agaribacterium sp. ZY112]|uniref:hypothetical protein n=1 Tax=Agaribacterium sp. ZY112 TaxID=3233574 RepID=UPI003523769C
MQLQRAQLQCLLNAINHKRQLELWQAQLQSPAPALLLGADLELKQGQQLLLSSNIDLRGQRTVFIRLRHDDEDLICRLYVESYQQGLLNCVLEQCRWSTNRRWENRLRFADYKGPEVQLTTQSTRFNHLRLNAHLRNINSRGIAIDFWGAELTTPLSRTQDYDLRLYFNQHFDINLKAQLLEQSTERKPSFHQRARFLFKQEQELALSQLNTLLEHIEYSQKPMFAA